jgi:ankyrin repeat protein
MTQASPLREQISLMKILDGIAEQCPEFVNEVLAANDINNKSRDGHTALAFLLDEKFKRNAENWCFQTENLAMSLIDSGADPNTKTPDGKSVLSAAAILGYAGLAYQLIQAGAVVSRENFAELIEGIPAAIFRADSCILRALESVDADMTHVNPQTMETLAHLVCKKNISAESALKLLARNGVDFDQQDCNGRTCLMICCMIGSRCENIETILDIGVDVNIQDNKGNTAITLLSRRNFCYLPNLVSLGGDVYHRNADGYSLYIPDKDWEGILNTDMFKSTYSLARACREGDVEGVKRCLEALRGTSKWSSFC